VLLSFFESARGTAAKSITALRILEEAATIAAQSNNPELQRILAAAAARIPDGQPVLDKMRSTIAAMGATLTRGEGTFIGYVKVVNGSGRLLDIYVDGKDSGFLYSGEEGTYSTGIGTTQVRVTDAFGNTATEVVEVRQNETFAWTINP
jgi:hypothetical protein